MADTASDVDRLSSDALQYVLMGPSGAGKSALARSLTDNHERRFKFELTQSWRTRPPRPGIDDPNIHVTPEEFAAAEAAGKFLFTMPLYTDVAGLVVPHQLPPDTFWLYIYFPEYALRLREFYPKTRFIEILPGDLDSLKQRIVDRDPSITPDELTRRLSAAELEIEHGSAITDLTFINSEPLEIAGQKFYELIAGDITAQANI